MDLTQSYESTTVAYRQELPENPHATARSFANGPDAPVKDTRIHNSRVRGKHQPRQTSGAEAVCQCVRVSKVGS